MSPSFRPVLKFALLLTFLGGAYYLVFVHHTEEERFAALDAVKDFVRTSHPLAARLLYVAIYIVGTVVLLPGLLLSFIGANLFGVWEGTLWTWIGAVIGATLAFFVAKSLGRESVDRLVGGRLKALDDRLREHGFSGLLLIRLLPIFPFNGVNFGCGLTSIRPRDYIAATAIGILPGTFIYQYLFATLGDKVLHEGFAWSDLMQPDVLAALGAFVAFLVITKLIVGRFKGPKHLHPAPHDVP
jgi:uncharacterized membrane protein YdjX (TVP38/TMEM64 family)